MVDQLKTNGAEILVVDDEPIVLNFTVTLLRREGYAVAEADSGEEALFVFKQNQSSVKLLLTDVVMPETTGPELALDLLQLKPDLKILFMTACCDSLPNALQRCSVIVKPFTIKDLVESVGQLLAKANPPCSARPHLHGWIPIWWRSRPLVKASTSVRLSDSTCRSPNR